MRVVRSAAPVLGGLLVALAALAPSAGAVSGSLTTNPSFREDTAGWTSFNGTVERVEDDDAPAGSSVAEITVEDANASDYTLDDDPASVPSVVAGRRYTASAWVRAGSSSSRGRAVRLVLRGTRRGGEAGTCAQSDAVALSATWQRITTTCTPARSGAALDVYVARQGDVTAGERFRVDDVTITTPSATDVPAGNLTPDPSFTAAEGPWRSSQARVRRAPGGDDAPDGATVGRIDATLPAAREPVVIGAAEAPVAASAAGRTYAAEAWVRGDVTTNPFASAATARLVIRERDAAGRTTSTVSTPVRLLGLAWQRVAVTAAPAAGRRLDVRLQIDGARPGDTFGVDALTLVTTPLASVYGSATTIRSDRPLPSGGSPTASIAAAGNETASFQVALRTTGSPLTGLRVATAGELSGPGGATLPASAVALARERDYEVRVPTDGEGGQGRWPDALLPDRDPLLGGDGGAFPLTLTPEAPATVWADVAVPPDARPGRYTGALRVTADGTPPVDVPIELTVRPFTLPATSSLRSLFALNPYAVCAASDDGGSGGYRAIRRPDGAGCDPGDEETWRVFARIAALGLRDRISIANPYPTPRMVPPSAARPVRPAPARDGAPVDEAAAFDAYVRPLLDGTSQLGTLPGARLTTITTQWECLQELQQGCTRGWRTFLETHVPAEIDRFLPWVCDEPSFDDAAHFTPWKGDDDTPGSCENDRRLAREGWPGVPIKITTPISDEGLYADGDVDPSKLGRSAVDVLAPNQTDLVPRGGASTRGRYDERPADARALAPWWYISCTSGGCDPGAKAGDDSIDDPTHDGWPSYSIDQPASQASSSGWMAFIYRLGGESYFDVAAGFDEGPDFQYGIRTYGTNGDGLLFYPGSVVVDGRREAMPLESIRLKRIREGYEDYEYLHRLERCGRRQDALAVSRRLFGDEDDAMHRTTVSQGRLGAAREELARLIVRGRC